LKIEYCQCSIKVGQRFFGIMRSCSQNGVIEAVDLSQYEPTLTTGLPLIDRILLHG